MYGTLISSVTVGAGGATSIDFTSIPATYTDLVLVCSLRDTYASTALTGNLRFNGDNTGSYSTRMLYGTGSAVASYSTNSVTNLYHWYLDGGSMTSSTFGNAIFHIPNYAGSTNKSVSIDYVTENNATAAYGGITAAIWANTSAINRVTLYGWDPGTSLLAQYSTAYLYGLTKGSGGATVS